MEISIAMRGKKREIGERLFKSDFPELDWIIVKKSRRNVILSINEVSLKYIVRNIPQFKDKLPSVEVVTKVIQSTIDMMIVAHREKIDKLVQKYWDEKIRLQLRRF